MNTGLFTSFRAVEHLFVSQSTVYMKHTMWDSSLVTFYIGPCGLGLITLHITIISEPFIPTAIGYFRFTHGVLDMVLLTNSKASLKTAANTL